MPCFFFGFFNKPIQHPNHPSPNDRVIPWALDDHCEWNKLLEFPVLRILAVTVDC